MQTKAKPTSPFQGAENADLGDSKKRIWLSAQIKNIALLAQKTFGPRHLTGIYEKCMAYHFDRQKIPFTVIKANATMRDDELSAVDTRRALIVDDLVFILCRSEAGDVESWRSQLELQLKQYNIPVGYIFNFDTSDSDGEILESAAVSVNSITQN